MVTCGFVPLRLCRNGIAAPGSKAGLFLLRFGSCGMGLLLR